jgi:Transposase, Mutator family
MVRFAILGPVELFDGERQLRVGGPRQLALLACFLLHANRAVSMDLLIDALWSDQDRQGAVKRLQVAVTRLRKSLEVGSASEPRLRTTAVTSMQKSIPISGGGDPSRPADEESSVDEARDRLAGLLPDDALQDALKGLDPDEITGPGGLVSQLAGRVIETALGAELTEHLGYPPGQAPPGGAGNHRNGHTAKTLQTELGPVAVKTPRDRRGSFEPQLVGKRQTRLAGLDEKILGLYAGGMTVRDIEAHLRDLYGVQIGRDTISTVTDAVLEDVAAWRTRPLDPVYPIVYFDCLMVKVREDRSVRSRACYLAVGVSVEGERDVLGLWWQETEGAKFWLAVLNDLHRRGVADVLVACVDGLKGFPEAIEAVFPQQSRGAARRA